MSDPLRIALVAEGPTDEVVIEAALRSMLGERPFVLKRLFPEGSAAFGPMGTGWIGVYKWCHAVAKRGGGRLSGDEMIFGPNGYQILLLHLDGDVAGFAYADGSIVPEPTDGVLPCAKGCPPPADTTDDLRKVLLSWCGETDNPPKTVVCMPSKSTEAWVVASLFPNDQAMAQGIECYANPESRLGQQPAAVRIRKKERDYRSRSMELEQAWPRIAAPTALGEAHRFQTEFMAVLPPPEPPAQDEP